MKKIILLAVLGISFSAWATDCVSNGGRYPDCSEAHPFLIEDINLDYLYVPEPKLLQPLSYLKEDLLSVPDFHGKEKCLKTKDPACEKLKDVEEYQQKIVDWNTSKEKKELLQENKDVERKNRFISIKNNFIQENNSLYNRYRRMVKIEGLYTTCIFLRGDVVNTAWESVDGSLLITLYPNPINSLQREINDYLEEVNKIITDNFYRQKNNQRIHEENLKTEKENAQIEEENAKIEKQFKEYYTPKKTEQLIKDYVEVLSKKCVGCDYPESLNVTEYVCEECPNRKYEDGKCILKENKK